MDEPHVRYAHPSVWYSFVILPNGTVVTQIVNWTDGPACVNCWA
jgi:hypothetical protein